MTFDENEIYHLYGRGINKKNIFIDDEDRSRFLLLILYFQSPIQIHNTYWYTNRFLKKGVFPIGQDKLKDILKSRTVKLISFTIMGNHFHLMVQSLIEMGISVYMQRVLTAYSKYFNKKYDLKGHTFEGPFKATHIENNNQLLHTSAYIHKNPKDIGSDYTSYRWSSFLDFVGNNRWTDLLDPSLIVDQFNQKQSYYDFVSTSPAKETIL